MSTPNKPKQIKCPQCGRLTFYSSENPFRPFCSERCKLIDLGQWASESYKVPTEDPVDIESGLNPEDFTGSEDEP
jgi:endogenous inhibitor of DNA gyrase (YacG/DUF329 family)